MEMAKPQLKMPKQKPYATEAELCAAFIAALPEGWTPYAETGGWDVLLVRAPDGFQVGVQAKLKLNAFVLAQALDEYDHIEVGPDCRAILVPAGECGVGLTYLCAYIGVTILRIAPKKSFAPPLPGDRERENSRWHEWAPARRHELPEYVPDVAAGVASPLQLTTWKISALKIAVLLEERGFVTRRDFSHVGIDHRRWIAREAGWLTVADGRYLPGPRLPNFKKQHPRVFEQIKADAAKWMPKIPELNLTPPPRLPL